MLLALPYGYPAQWGDLGGWITGVSTVVLALVTFVGLRLQRGELERQRGELESQQEQINEQRELTRHQTAWITAQLAAKRKEQARQVQADGMSVTADVGKLGHGNWQYVRVTNASDRPIYDVSCYWTAGSREQEPYVMGQVSGPLTHMTGPLVGVIGAMPRPMLRRSDPPLDFVFERQPVKAEEYRFRVTFTDDDGVAWALDAQQRLTEVMAAVEPELATAPDSAGTPAKSGWKRLLFWQ